MRIEPIARGLVVLLLSLAVLLGGRSLWAAEPNGDSPANGRDVTCDVELVAAGGETWHKVAFENGKELALDLTAIDGVYFQVFAPDAVDDWPTVGEPMGKGVPNPGGPTYETSWQGQLDRADYIPSYYFIRLTNTIGIQAQYRLCAKQVDSAVIEPTGGSPADGLTSPPCTLEMLDGNAEMWHKVPYPAGKELELYLVTAYPDVGFQVFNPDAITDWPTLGQPVGRGTKNPTEPDRASSWEGHLTTSDYYYVRVTNAGGGAVLYRLCTVEKAISGPVPTPTPGYAVPTGVPAPAPPGFGH